MEVSVEVHKTIICAIYTIVFSHSGGGVDDVLFRLPLIKQIIKDINLICSAFSVKHPGDNFGSMNEFVQYVQKYFQYVYIPI